MLRVTPPLMIRRLNRARRRSQSLRRRKKQSAAAVLICAPPCPVPAPGKRRQNFSCRTRRARKFSRHAPPPATDPNASPARPPAPHRYAPTKQCPAPRRHRWWQINSPWCARRCKSAQAAGRGGPDSRRCTGLNPGWSCGWWCRSAPGVLSSRGCRGVSCAAPGVGGNLTVGGGGVKLPRTPARRKKRKPACWRHTGFQVRGISALWLFSQQENHRGL